MSMRISTPAGQTATSRYRGLGAPQLAAKEQAPVAVPLQPSMHAPELVRNSGAPSYPAQDVLSGALRRWNGTPTDSAYAPRRINPDVTIRGATETGRLVAHKPESPTVTRDGLIVFTSASDVTRRRILHAARLDAAGALIPGGTAIVDGCWTRPRVVVARDTFLVAGEGTVSLVAHDSGTLRVINTAPLDSPLAPIRTREGCIVIATAGCTMQAYNVEDDTLVRTGFVDYSNTKFAPEGSWLAPFQLENGLIISAMTVWESKAATLIATRLNADGTLQRVGQVTLGKLGAYRPAPNNRVIFCEDKTNATTVFEVDVNGHFSTVAKVPAHLRVSHVTVNSDGRGIAGDVDKYDRSYLFAPVRYSGAGHIELSMDSPFTSREPPILTSNGTLITTSTKGVTVEQLELDGKRTPRFHAPGVVACNAIAVTPSGFILVPTNEALVALGAA